MGLSILPLRVLGGSLASPLSGGSARGTPVLAGGTVPASAGSGSTREARLSLPVGTSALEASLDGSGALLVDTGGLVLLDLLLSLGLRVAV